MSTFAQKHGRYASKRGRAWTPGPVQDALVETMCLAACVDGILEEDEARALALQIRATPGFTHLDDRQLAAAIQEILGRAGRDGVEARVRTIAEELGHDRSTREEAYALATLFVLFDGFVGNEEQRFLDLLQKHLAIPDDTASRVAALLAEP
jgi:tellurite resistance protein